MNGQPTNGLRALLWKNLFRIIILTIGLIVAGAAYKFEIKVNAEDNDKQDIQIEKIEEDVSSFKKEIREAVNKINVDVGSINTSIEFIINAHK